MKSTEFISEDINSEMRNDDSRRAKLKLEVEAGMMPIVHNSSSTVDPVYTMGDLQALGWMNKTYTHDHEGEVDGWTRDYYGPAPVKVHTSGAKELRILKPGTTLE